MCLNAAWTGASEPGGTGGMYPPVFNLALLIPPIHRPVYLNKLCLSYALYPEKIWPALFSNKFAYMIDIKTFMSFIFLIVYN